MGSCCASDDIPDAQQRRRLINTDDADPIVDGNETKANLDYAAQDYHHAHDPQFNNNNNNATNNDTGDDMKKDIHHNNDNEEEFKSGDNTNEETQVKSGGSRSGSDFGTDDDEDEDVDVDNNNNINNINVDDEIEAKEEHSTGQLSANTAGTEPESKSNNEQLLEIEAEKEFEMLEFISTSPTVSKNTSFMLDPILQELGVILNTKKGKKSKKTRKCGTILCAFVEEQRVSVGNAYIGEKKMESLQKVFEQQFSGNILLLLCELIRSRAENDAIRIQKAVSSLKTNTNKLNQILMTRTNTQLKAIAKAYKSKYNQKTLAEALGANKKKKSSYQYLLNLVINCERNEYHPRKIKSKDVRVQADILYDIFETKTRPFKKEAVIDIFIGVSWAFVAAMCTYYQKISDLYLRDTIV
jgi:hypothetical protein